MKQSGYLKRQQAVRGEAMEAASKLTRQFMMDTAQIALHRMGWGYKRIKEFTDVWADVHNEYFAGTLRKGAEQDVFQEHMDREIRDFMNGNPDNAPMIPFNKRYPEIREIVY